MQRAITTKSGWIICGNCGHKIAKLTAFCDAGQKPNVTLQIESKCTSCKEINIINMEVLKNEQ